MSTAAVAIKGALQEVNLEEGSFRVYPCRVDGGRSFVMCRYCEVRHETQVKLALGKQVVVTGEPTREKTNGEIEELAVSGIEILPDAPAPTARREARALTARELLASGLVGAWRDRGDIGDSQEFARLLRERAERRS